jgi:hypothetical protein
MYGTTAVDMRAKDRRPLHARAGWRSLYMSKQGFVVLHQRLKSVDQLAVLLI